MSDPLSAASLLKRPESLELYSKLVPDDGSVDRLTAACWKYLLLCMETPRPSSQLAAITERLSSLAPLLGCQADLDPVGNLRFRKNPSSDAKANVPGICMQGHMDMVTTANSDTVFDFEKSPIDAFIENGWLKARGTTLGADNGVGLAGGLAVLEFAGKEGALAEHGLLELLCTVDEETTMIGAEKLAPHPFLQSSILLNLDSEEEYSICIGCAGGAEYSNEIDVEQVLVPEGTSFLQISISGLFGGHSGVDIHKGKGNAIKILARTLLTTIEKVPFQIVSLNGGGACNVIPRESFAIVAIESGKVDALKQELQVQFEKVQKVYIAVEHKEIVEGQKRESNIKLTLTDGIEAAPASIASSQSTQKIIDWLANFPDGVLRFNYDVKDLTETSINLCRTEFSSPATVFVSRSFARSSSSAQLDFVYQQLKGLSRLAGARISEPENAFPGWDPDVTSKPLAILTDDHKKLFDREPHVYAIHAGLECGLIQAVYPSMICISIGPQVENAHSPDERLSIASLDLFMRLTGKFVASIASHY